jgi:uncharacterized protein
MGSSNAMSRERLPALDFARGVCVLAVLLPMLPWFCRPFELFAVHPTAGGSWDDHILAGLLFFFDHKILPLFAIIFGMGLALHLRTLGDQAKKYFPPYLARMGVLFVFGLANTLLFWWGDLLAVYAFVGLHAIIFLLSPRGVERFAFYSCLGIFYVLLVVGVVLGLMFLKPNGTVNLSGLDLKKVAATGPPISLLVGPGDTAERFFEYIASNNQLRIYRGNSLFPVFEHRLFLHFKELLHIMLITSWYMIGCALLGARLVRAGLLESTGRGLARRLVLLGLFVGVPCQVVAVVLFYWEQPLFSYLFNQLGALPVSLLYLVILLRIAEAGWFAAFQGAVRAVGRTALSNYWMQCVLACVIFHGYGLGWYGVSIATGMLVVLGIWIGQLILSPLWLTLFDAGPLEWLWRSLAERRPRPLWRRA